MINYKFLNSHNFEAIGKVTVKEKGIVIVGRYRKKLVNVDNVTQIVYLDLDICGGLCQVYTNLLDHIPKRIAEFSDITALGIFVENSLDFMNLYQAKLNSK